MRIYVRGKSSDTDHLSYLSNYKIYHKIIRIVSNLMINMNKYFVLKNIQSYKCYMIKCNIMFLLFKYLNNNFF